MSRSSACDQPWTLYHPAISTAHPAFYNLPAKEQHLVRTLEKQCDRWSGKWYFKRNRSDRLIAALNGYDFAGKLATCMMVPNQYTKTSTLARCQLDWFCPFCAYLKGQDLLKKYVGAWTPDGWHEMVLSLRNGINILHPDHFEMNTVWDVMQVIIKELSMQKQMEGYIAWLEIKVHQFYPQVICAPHVHALLRCEQPPDRSVFERIIAERWASQDWAAQEWIDSHLTPIPDLFLEPVKSEAHFYQLLRYIKPIEQDAGPDPHLVQSA